MTRPTTKAVEEKPACRRARPPVIRALLVVGALTGLSIGAALWWEDRPLRAIERSLKQQQFERALEGAEGFLAANRGDVRGLDLQARALAGLGRWTEATRVFDQIGAQSQASQRAWSQGLLYQERWTEALVLLSRLYELSPNDPDILHELAACYAKLGYFEESIQNAERLMNIPGQEQRGRVLLGMLHFRRGNHRLAIRAWQPVVEKEADLSGMQITAAELFEAYGRSLLREGRPDEARTALERAVANSPTAEGRNALAEACEVLQDLPAAIANWKLLLADEPGNATAREGLARVALQRGLANDARTWLEPLLGRDGLTASTAFLMQRVSVIEHDKLAAAEWEAKAALLRKRERRDAELEQVVRDAPQSYWGRALRAHRFASEGNRVQALALVDGLLEQNAEPVFVRELADALRNQKPLPSLDLVPLEQF